MKVLVTGGGGYIGSHCVRRLRAHGFNTLVLDSFERGHRAAIEGPFVVGDLLHPPDLDFAFTAGPFDVVMHFAALVIVDESVAQPARYLQVNTVGTLNLLEAMLRHRCSRLVFSSTAAVYGMPQQVPISEGHRRCPVNPYGLSKSLAEDIISYYGLEHGIHWVSFRYFNAAGREFPYPAPQFREHDTHLITRALNAVGEGTKPLQIFGGDYPTPDGTCVRDYVHVGDICAAHLQALDYMGNGGRSDYFNIGSGLGFSDKEVVAVTRKVTGKPVRAEIAARRPGDPALLVASNEKLRIAMGWKPQYPNLENIIGSAWSWRRDREPEATVARSQH